MQSSPNFPLISIVNDIDALITEIDDNPRLSSWVIRLVLKSIKDKAKEMAIETDITSYSVHNTVNVEPNTKIKALRQSLK